MSLKELRERILFVGNTKKMTDAMQIVASSKMHKAKVQLTNSYPYYESISQLLSLFLREGGKVTNPLLGNSIGKKKLLVVISSNESLCGAYNQNIIKAFKAFYEEERENIVQIYCIGKKIKDAVKKMNIPYEVPSWDTKSALLWKHLEDFAQDLMSKFLSGSTDEISFLYTKGKNIMSQEVKREVWLPLPIDPSMKGNEYGDDELSHRYILEPNKEEILNYLLQERIKTKLQRIFTSASFSEHASRMMAMQTAGDNARDLLNELNIQYNKLRQNIITMELNDMAGALM